MYTLYSLSYSRHRHRRNTTPPPHRNATHYAQGIPAHARPTLHPSDRPGPAIDVKTLSRGRRRARGTRAVARIFQSHTPGYHRARVRSPINPPLQRRFRVNTLVSSPAIASPTRNLPFRAENFRSSFCSPFPPSGTSQPNNTSGVVHTLLQPLGTYRLDRNGPNHSVRCDTKDREAPPPTVLHSVTRDQQFAHGTKTEHTRRLIGSKSVLYFLSIIINIIIIISN